EKTVAQRIVLAPQPPSVCRPQGSARLSDDLLARRVRRSGEDREIVVRQLAHASAFESPCVHASRRTPEQRHTKSTIAPRSNGLCLGVPPPSCRYRASDGDLASHHG